MNYKHISMWLCFQIRVNQRNSKKNRKYIVVVGQQNYMKKKNTQRQQNNEGNLCLQNIEFRIYRKKRQKPNR